ncbi:hypothetical protein D3C72_542170 [compost metagenome]
MDALEHGLHLRLVAIEGRQVGQGVVELGIGRRPLGREVPGHEVAQQPLGEAVLLDGLALEVLGELVEQMHEDALVGLVERAVRGLGQAGLPVRDRQVLGEQERVGLGGLREDLDGLGVFGEGAAAAQNQLEVPLAVGGNAPDPGLLGDAVLLEVRDQPARGLGQHLQLPAVLGEEQRVEVQGAGDRRQGVAALGKGDLAQQDARDVVFRQPGLVGELLLAQALLGEGLFDQVHRGAERGRLGIGASQGRSPFHVGQFHVAAVRLSNIFTPTASRAHPMRMNPSSVG